MHVRIKDKLCHIEYLLPKQKTINKQNVGLFRWLTDSSNLLERDILIKGEMSLLLTKIQSHVLSFDISLLLEHLNHFEQINSPVFFNWFILHIDAVHRKSSQTFVINFQTYLDCDSGSHHFVIDENILCVQPFDFTVLTNAAEGCIAHTRKLGVWVKVCKVVISEPRALQFAENVRLGRETKLQ